MVEFHETTRRHGTTPVRFAHDHGVQRPGTVLGHRIFLDRHSWPHWRTRDDLRLLAEGGVAVAHCPTPFWHYGVMPESLPGYLDAGTMVGIGTETSPHNPLEEMRLASTPARVACVDMTRIDTAAVPGLDWAGRRARVRTGGAADPPRRIHASP